MTRRLIPTLLAAALVVVVAPAQAAPPEHVGELVVYDRDGGGDVKLAPHSGGLNDKQRQSIDINTVRVYVGEDITRFQVLLRRITTSAKFEQMVFVTLKSPKDANPAYRTDIGMSAQSLDLAYAYYTPDSSGDDLVACDPLTADADKFRVWVDVPHECIPPGPVKIRLTSATGFFRSEGVGYSRDKMKVPGSHVLK